MKKIFLFLAICLIPSILLAKKTTYIYTDNRFNFVKIEEMGAKEANELTVNHPFSLSEEQMRSILKEIRLNRSFVIKKEVETQDVFDERAINFLSRKLVEAFSRATGNDKVVFSYLTKDPAFVLRNDRLTLGSAWVHGTELHIKFEKLFAKLTGDYDKRGDFTKVVARARGLRVSLAVRDGQMLGENSVDELVIDTTYDFSQPAVVAGETAEPPETVGATGTREKKGAILKQGAQAGSQLQVTAKPKTTKERLEELDVLRRDGLITEKEYKEKRKEILEGL